MTDHRPEGAPLPEPAIYWLPTRPYDVIAAINRSAAATGSPRYAQLAADADYNGHWVGVSFNAYRGYWIAEYTWAGRRVLARGTFAQALRAAVEEYNRGALGATVRAYAETEEDVAACVAAGLVPWSEDLEKAQRATWVTPLHEEVSGAFLYEQQLGIPAVGFLANSKTLDEYKAKIDAAIAERRAARRPA